MDDRLRFVTECLDGYYPMSELCERYGISRQAGYKWIARYQTEGAAGLSDRSRRPHQCSRATAPVVVEALLAARRKHPTWGPKKLLAGGWPALPRPALSTASALLKRHGLVSAPRRRVRAAHPGKPLAHATAPNRVWSVDYKGEFRTGDGAWCYPLTVLDGYSRYLLACQRLPCMRTEPTRAVFERVFREFGLPDRIRSDNGTPFATAWALGRLSPLSVWWIRLGVIPDLIQPARPDQNGRLERFHRTLKAETARPPASCAAVQQRRFTQFRAQYNDVRPHEALGQRPPLDLYGASARPYPERLPPVDYAAAVSVRRVGPSGTVAWQGHRVFVSHTLRGQDIGLLEVGDGIWTVYFSTIALGHFDERRGQIRPLRPVTEGGARRRRRLAPCARKDQ